MSERLPRRLLVVERHGDAYPLLEREPDALVLVRRAGDRALVFRCPCRCGEHVVVNLDSRAGHAWRMRVEPADAAGPPGDGVLVTLLPSVWRTSGCRAHFVLWRGDVWWCRDEEDATAWHAPREDAPAGDALGDERSLRSRGEVSPRSADPRPDRESDEEHEDDSEAPYRRRWPRELVDALREEWRRLRRPSR